MMSKAFAIAAALALLGLSIPAQANVFNLGEGFTSLETVAVGDAGNAADTRYATPGYGSVGYNYNIGKYEVTAKQYTEFLNDKAKCDGDPYGLYNTAMTSLGYGCNIQRSGGGTVANPYSYTVANDWANRPVNYVNYWDACRFTNWLVNGQGTGDTEVGAYSLNGYSGTGITGRNAGATWAVTSEDEWYKAAYYKGGGASAGYWDYPTSSNTLPSNVGSDGYTDPGNHANYLLMLYADGYTYTETIGSPYYRTNVGEFENSASAYGTFDQGGNVFEWNEALVSGTIGHSMRGGSFGIFDSQSSLLASCRDYYFDPGYEGGGIGFRVSGVPDGWQPVPEPSSILALLCGVGGLAWFRKRT